MPDAAYFEMAPDWLCEVPSPATRTIDLRPKREIYARAGVLDMWLVDPQARWIEAFELQSEQWQPLGKREGNDPVALPPFGAVRFS
ncbi:MAG: Uma2 family endonuclease [Gammaproteobacteria bacterium]|nr:Uma2 family endonuclease [Gammaproteobacteria bacterium]MCY4278991.1 Uma2 family endonuclease [Gammaproteobacteria bacterium]